MKNTHAQICLYIYVNYGANMDMYMYMYITIHIYMYIYMYLLMHVYVHYTTGIHAQLTDIDVTGNILEALLKTH